MCMEESTGTQRARACPRVLALKDLEPTWAQLDLLLGRHCNKFFSKVENCHTNTARAPWYSDITNALG